jgi:hypothetical protein
VLREAGRLGAACGTLRADLISRIVPGGPLLTALRDGPDPVLEAETAESLAALTGQPLRLLDAWPPRWSSAPPSARSSSRLTTRSAWMT